MRRTVILGILAAAALIIAIASGGEGDPDVTLFEPAHQTATNLSAYDAAASVDPAVGSAAPGRAAADIGYDPQGRGAIIVLTEPSGGGWWTEPDSADGLHIVSGTAEALEAYGMSTLPSWILIGADGTVALRHEGPIAQETYLLWASLLSAATP